MGFGATPQLPHGKRPVCQTRSTTGAGSEASLPVTSRSRRSAPNLLYQPLAYCRAKWARPTSIERSVSLAAGLFCCRGFRLGGGDQRAFRSPFGNLRAAHPCLLVCCRRFRHNPTSTKPALDRSRFLPSAGFVVQKSVSRRRQLIRDNRRPSQLRKELHHRRGHIVILAEGARGNTPHCVDARGRHPPHAVKQSGMQQPHVRRTDCAERLHQVQHLLGEGLMPRQIRRFRRNFQRFQGT